MTRALNFRELDRTEPMLGHQERTTNELCEDYHDCINNNKIESDSHSVITLISSEGPSGRDYGYVFRYRSRDTGKLVEDLDTEKKNEDVSVVYLDDATYDEASESWNITNTESFNSISELVSYMEDV